MRLSTVTSMQRVHRHFLRMLVGPSLQASRSTLLLISPCAAIGPMALMAISVAVSCCTWTVTSP